MKWIRHVASETNGEEQFCLICGLELQNNRGVSYPPSPTPWWPAGDIYLGGQNPTMFQSVEPLLRDGDTIEDCKL